MAISTLALCAGDAAAIDERLTPRGVAMGGAGMASATGALGPLLNPAAIVLTRQYSGEASYGFRPQNSGHRLNLALVDSITSKLAAGVYYSYQRSSPRFAYGTADRTVEAVREGHEVGVAIALPVSERFGLGMTGKYLRASTVIDDGSMGTITLDSTRGNASANGFTFDAGMFLRLGDILNLGFAGYNLAPLRSIEAPLGMGGGISLLFDPLLIVADARFEFDRYHHAGTTNPDGSYSLGDRRTTTRFSGGLEFLAARVMPIRLGVSHDTGLPTTDVSAGLGFLSRSLGLDVAYRHRIGGGEESLITGGIRLFLE